MQCTSFIWTIPRETHQAIHGEKGWQRPGLKDYTVVVCGWATISCLFPLHFLAKHWKFQSFALYAIFSHKRLNNRHANIIIWVSAKTLKMPKKDLKWSFRYELRNALIFRAKLMNLRITVSTKKVWVWIRATISETTFSTKRIQAKNMTSK